MVLVKDHFPVAQEYTYLNTASCGLLSKELVAWRRKQDEQLLAGGSLFRDLHKPHILSIRETVAQYFGTRPDCVALVPNFSFGWNSLLEGLPKDSRFLLIHGDYPSIHWPIERRGFESVCTIMDAQLESNILQAVRQYKPDVLAISMVQYISGIKLDLDFLAQLKRDFKDLLIVADGTQYLGTEAYNFEEGPIDVLGASAYKWMLAGYGNGIVMIKPEAQERFKLKTMGYNSADADFEKKNDIEFVGYLEPGHQATLTYGSIQQSLLWMDGIGRDHIQTHLQTLTQMAAKAFKESGRWIGPASERSNPSTIFNLKGDQTLFDKMKKEGVIASLRGDGIRISFHLYNDEQDLEKVLKLL